VPATWWDATFDRHALFGSFKHGVGDWALILADPQLCFATKIAPLEDKEKEKEKGEGKAEKKEDSAKKAPATAEKKEAPAASAGNGGGDKKEETAGEEKKKEERTADGKFIWPGSKLVNIRLRKLLKAVETWRKTQNKQKKRITAKKQKVYVDPMYVPPRFYRESEIGVV
jgi:hypothetical protein